MSVDLLGIYHIAGLGTSPGAVTAPLNYHFERFKRQISLQEPDPFFQGSGSYSNSLDRGNLEGVIIFTTPTIFNGTLEPHQMNNYFTFENENWHDNIKTKLSGPKNTSFNLVRAECQKIKSNLTNLFSKDRNFSLYVVFFDFDEDLLSINTKALQIFRALGSSGSLGKEIWINLVGGQNKIQLSFFFSAMLMKNYSRAYYYQCPRDHTRYLRPIAKFDTTKIADPDPNYWLDLPIIPSNLGKLESEILLLFHSLNKKSLELSEIKQNLIDRKIDYTTILQILKNQRYISYSKNSYELTSYGNEIVKFLIELKTNMNEFNGIYDLERHSELNGDHWLRNIPL